MKTQTKEKLNIFLKIILFALIPVLSVLLVIAHLKNVDLNNQLNEKIAAKAFQEEQVLQEAKIINRKIAKNGIETVTIAALSNILPVGKVLKSLIVDSIAKANEVKPKQIISYIQTGFVSEAKYLKATQIIDSLKRRVATYQSKYINISYTPNKDTTDTAIGFFSYKYNGQLNSLQYWNRYKILGLKIGRKQALINTALLDTNATIYSVKNFSVPFQPKKFSASLQLRTVYNVTAQKLAVGPGISLDYKEKLNFLGYAYYNFSVMQWQYVVGINTNIITF
jgi:hypothetical protein